MNDSIPALDELIEPAPVSFTFGAPGWYVIAGIVICLILVFACLAYIRYRKNRYRRTALHFLEQEEQRLLPERKSAELIYTANMLIKRIGMERYGREAISSLRGKEWLDYLNQTWKAASFNQDDEQMISLLYSSENTVSEEQAHAFINKTKHWIKTHRYVLRHSK